MAERRWWAGSLAVAITIIGLLAVTVVTLVSAGRPPTDRVQELAQQLRCPVCKSVSIAESPSDTATAMRQVVAEQVAAGRSDAEIIGYFRARYGDWVWLDPPARDRDVPSGPRQRERRGRRLVARVGAGRHVAGAHHFLGEDLAALKLGRRLPIMISGTITDRSGRTLSGQTAEAFWNSVKHATPFAVGFNCALGADLMRPFIAEMARVADTLVAAYPNAGLPNEMGQYDEQPHETAHAVEAWAKEGLVNILGGCCGTTPEHIRHVAESVKGVLPRKPPERAKALRLAGLEPFELA